MSVPPEDAARRDQQGHRPGEQPEQVHLDPTQVGALSKLLHPVGDVGHREVLVMAAMPGGRAEEGAR